MIVRLSGHPLVRNSLKWLARHLGQEKPKSMAALKSLMTHFCVGEDSWLAHSNNMTKSPGNSDTKDSSGRSRRNKQKRRINSDNTEDTTVNAGFKGSKPGQRKKPFKRSTPGPSSLDRILDRSCQIHGTPDVVDMGHGYPHEGRPRPIMGGGPPG